MSATREWTSNQVQGKWYCIADIDTFLEEVEMGVIRWNVRPMRKKGTILPYDFSLSLAQFEGGEVSPCFVVPLSQKTRISGREGQYGQFALCEDEGYECMRDQLNLIMKDALDQVQEKHEACILATNAGDDTVLKWPWKADIHDTIAELQDSKTSFMTIMLDGGYVNESEGVYGPVFKLSQFKKRPFAPKKVKKEEPTFEAEPAPVDTKKRRAK